MSRIVWTLSVALGAILIAVGGLFLFAPGESLAMDGLCCGNGDCICGFNIMHTPVLSDDGPTCQAATWRLMSQLEAHAPSIDGYCFQEFDLKECRPNSTGNGYWISGSMRYKRRTCL